MPENVAMAPYGALDWLDIVSSAPPPLCDGPSIAPMSGHDDVYYEYGVGTPRRQRREAMRESCRTSADLMWLRAIVVFCSAMAQRSTVLRYGPAHRLTARGPLLACMVL